MIIDYDETIGHGRGYPTGLSHEEKMDVVIHGLGWFTISGKVKNVKVFVNKNKKHYRWSL